MTAGGQRRRDTGAGTVEYVGMSVGVAFVLAAVVVLVTGPGFAGVAVARMCAAYNSVFQASLSCPTPGADGSQDPYEQATSGEYVALGDSYSSGQGASDYQDGTDFDDRDDLWPFNDDEEDHNRCRRSDNAYSEIVNQQNTFAGGYTFVACSGATMDDFDNPNDSETGEDPQLDALSEDTTLVTLTIGGNDLGFADVVKDCIVNGEGSVGFVASCQEKHDKRIAERLETLKQELIAQYLEIQRRAPNARIIVVGYPRLFPDNPQDNYGNLLFAEDQAWMNEKADQLNAMLAEAAQQAGVEFVDPTAAFAGHGIGSDDPWINDLDWGGPGMMLVDPGSFHPNAEGHAAIAELINEQLRNPSGTTSSTTVGSTVGSTVGGEPAARVVASRGAQMRSNRVLALTCLVSTVAAALLGLVALIKGIQIEGTPTAEAESALGQRIGIPALIGFASGVAGLLLQQRVAALTVCTALSVLCVLVALAAYLLG